jgi:hypothetical protein
MSDEMAKLPAAAASHPHSPLPPPVFNVLTLYKIETPFSYSREDVLSTI